ncbi:MAG: hypothetical protein KDD24_03570 [Flavobacteriales bacterium]|nr:hypothetical protein [Flavobacteriales bacterium]MCB9175389.1 hypothetical protein [Flavobacteriales bacterium]
MFTNKPFFLVLFLMLFFVNLKGQESAFKQFKKLSCAEKSWVVFHPFVAKKALQISMEARKSTAEVKQQKLLKGEGNGDQVDAFRHAYWMALLTFEIGERRARKLGKAHEKGNYQQFKKGKTEDGVLPDKISSEMDLFNNELGIEIAKTITTEKLIELIINKVKSGYAKIIKQDQEHHFLDAEGNIISTEELQGKWENKKVLVNSDY